MSSLDRWRTTGTPGHLSRRTPSNPKYDGVTSRLNTGMTVAKLNKRYAGTGGPNAHRRPTNQYFAKLKPTTLAKLVEPKMEAEESIYKVEKDDAVSTVTTMVDAMQMSDDAIKNAEVMILDCRPFEDYHACRVHGAYHYDIAQLGKATNQFPRELYFFKAPIESNKMIVIYDSGRDVEATQRLGNAFVEKVRAPPPPSRNLRASPLSPRPISLVTPGGARGSHTSRAAVATTARRTRAHRPQSRGSHTPLRPLPLPAAPAPTARAPAAGHRQHLRRPRRLPRHRDARAAHPGGRRAAAVRHPRRRGPPPRQRAPGLVAPDARRVGHRQLPTPALVGGRLLDGHAGHRLLPVLERHRRLAHTAHGDRRAQALEVTAGHKVKSKDRERALHS